MRWTLIELEDILKSTHPRADQGSHYQRGWYAAIERILHEVRRDVPPEEDRLHYALEVLKWSQERPRWIKAKLRWRLYCALEPSIATGHFIQFHTLINYVYEMVGREGTPEGLKGHVTRLNRDLALHPIDGQLWRVETRSDIGMRLTTETNTRGISGLWSEEEDQVLVDHYDRGYNVDGCMRLLPGRTHAAVTSRAALLNLTDHAKGAPAQKRATAQRQARLRSGR